MENRSRMLLEGPRREWLARMLRALKRHEAQMWIDAMVRKTQEDLAKSVLFQFLDLGRGGGRTREGAVFFGMDPAAPDGDVTALHTYDSREGRVVEHRTIERIEFADGVLFEPRAYTPEEVERIRQGYELHTWDTGIQAPPDVSGEWRPGGSYRQLEGPVSERLGRECDRLQSALQRHDERRVEILGDYEMAVDAWLEAVRKEGS